MDCPDDSDTIHFTGLLHSFGLTQHVADVTHKKGHTLDLVIARSGEDVVENMNVWNPLISDHFPVHFNLKADKPEPCRKRIVYSTAYCTCKWHFQPSKPI
jgi:hypothetical protein